MTLSVSPHRIWFTLITPFADTQLLTQRTQRNKLELVQRSGYSSCRLYAPHLPLASRACLSPVVQVSRFCEESLTSIGPLLAVRFHEGWEEMFSQAVLLHVFVMHRRQERAIFRTRSVTETLLSTVFSISLSCNSNGFWCVAARVVCKAQVAKTPVAAAAASLTSLIVSHPAFALVGFILPLRCTRSVLRAHSHVPSCVGR